ncbi:NrsF family protein [Xanthobacter agilis]|uniref:NrsF family protein n=1 Tax=Xanthobacter agilis TaxID=47492 RepID=UPI00372809D5
MKTDDLILALSADVPPRGSSLAVALGAAVAAGAVAALVVMQLTLGLRPDILAALVTPRFLFKCVETAALTLMAARLAARLARPGAPRWSAEAGLFVPALLLFGAVSLELASVPEASWARRMVGVNGAICLVMVPALSLAPLALLLAALRRGASESGALTGLVAGLAAGGIGAFFYAAHGTDDSPLFVAVWYTLAIGLVAALGAGLGWRLLRW